MEAYNQKGIISSICYKVIKVNQKNISC